ncbi:hypothetical protein A6R68_18977 [Neotoma lepida]|uniref:Uncharacterized protein n=1 Tax=Neotoma lepida TaxID=56216 RepID=A0A1A6HK77_NEOLE|nr:hypothetical protein A6R68_18977 [Neotoma lepida]
MSSPATGSKAEFKGHFFLEEQLQSIHEAVLRRWQDAVDMGWTCWEPQVGRWESQQDVSQTLVSSGIASGPSARPVSPQNNQSADPGLGGLAASYLNPVKSLVPQMPKLLKSLFPVRDDRRARQSSPLVHQVRKPQ